MSYQPRAAPITRVAPSPTGDPHVGTAYTALFNYALARRHGGTFILRVEDTDQARSTPESEEAILDCLRWLGLDWDQGPDVGGDTGPYRQSERTAIYREHASELIERGAAYRCFCTAERLTEMRQEQVKNKGAFGYDGRCRSIPAAESAQRAADGEPHVVRLKVDKGGRTVVDDLVRGEVVFENITVDDQVLLKSDGFPTYHMANVVDDHLMGVNHVLRGEEWLSSAPKHLMMYDAFGWEPPVLCHLALLRNPDKSKLSKRKNPTSIRYYRRLGILPDALLNYLGLMSWAMPDEREFFSLPELCEVFDPSKLSMGGPVFDQTKLQWLNARYIRESLTPEQLRETIKGWLLNDETLDGLIGMVQPRMQTLGEFVPTCEYMLAGRIPVDAELLVPKGKEAGDTLKALIVASAVLEDLPTWTAAGLDAALRRAAEAFGWELRDFLAPLFVAISGRKVALPLFESMELLGKDLGVVRLRDAREALGSLGRKKQDKLLKKFRKAYDALSSPDAGMPGH